MCADLPERERERDWSSRRSNNVDSLTRAISRKPDRRSASGRSFGWMWWRMTNLFSFCLPPCGRVTCPPPVFTTLVRYDQFRASYFVTIAQQKISPFSRIYRIRVKIRSLKSRVLLESVLSFTANAFHESLIHELSSHASRDYVAITGNWNSIDKQSAIFCRPTVNLWRIMITQSWDGFFVILNKKKLNIILIKFLRRYYIQL